MRKPEHLCAIENVIGATRENGCVLLKASALQKYEAGAVADMRTWPSRRNSYFIRKVAGRISRKHDEGEEGIRAAT